MLYCGYGGQSDLTWMLYGSYGGQSDLTLTLFVIVKQIVFREYLLIQCFSYILFIEVSMNSFDL